MIGRTQLLLLFVPLLVYRWFETQRDVGKYNPSNPEVTRALPQDESSHMKHHKSPATVITEVNQTSKNRIAGVGANHTKAATNTRSSVQPTIVTDNQYDTTNAISTGQHATTTALETSPGSATPEPNSSAPLLFHIIHTSEPSTFGEMQQRSLESIFYHHRTNAKVILHVKNLTAEQFDCDTVKRLIKSGYNLEVRPFDLKEEIQELKGIVNQTVLSQFSDNMEGYARNKRGFWKNNEANLLRLVLMYRLGGIYLDTDIFVVKSMVDLPWNTIGKEDGKVLNNAAMKFEPHHPFIVACLQSFFGKFDNTAWGQNGPHLITRVWKRQKGIINAAPSSAFQFFPFGAVKKECIKNTDEGFVLKKLKGIKKNAYGVHVNNRFLKGMAPNPGSACDCLRTTFCVVSECNTTSTCQALK